MLGIVPIPIWSHYLSNVIIIWYRTLSWTIKTGLIYVRVVIKGHCIPGTLTTLLGLLPFTILYTGSAADSPPPPPFDASAAVVAYCSSCIAFVSRSGIRQKGTLQTGIYN